MLDRNGNIVRNVANSNPDHPEENTDEFHRDWRIEDFLLCDAGVKDYHYPDRPMKSGVGWLGLLYINVTMTDWTDIQLAAKNFSDYAYSKGWDAKRDDFYTRFVTEHEWEKILHKGDDPRGSCDDLIYVIWNPDTKDVTKIRHDIPFWVPPEDTRTEEQKNKDRHFIYIICQEESTLDQDFMGESFYKIGNSKNPQERLKALQTSNPSQLKLVLEYVTPDKDEALFLERELHGIFAPFREKGEWFAIPDLIIEDFTKELVFMVNEGIGGIYEMICSDKWTQHNLMKRQMSIMLDELNEEEKVAFRSAVIEDMERQDSQLAEKFRESGLLE